MGTLSQATPLVLFEKSRLWAGTGFHLLPSFHQHHPTLHNTTIHTVTLTSTSSVHYTDTHPTRNVVCPSGVWLKNRPHSMPSFLLAWYPMCVIVQWVGIETHSPCIPKVYESGACMLSQRLWITALGKSTSMGLHEHRTEHRQGTNNQPQDKN